MSGFTELVEKKLIHVTGTKALAIDNILIAAPGAGLRLVISALILQNESATATTMILKNGITSIMRVLGQNQGDGIALVFPTGREWKLSENTALVLNLSGANSCGYSIVYWTEAAS